MAGRRGARDGILAGALPRLHERTAAGLVEPRVSLGQPDLWAGIQCNRLARAADERVLPALSVVYVRFFVKEPPVWQENRRRQRIEKREVHAPLLNIFKPGLLGNTLTACWWMASSFLVYYSTASFVIALLLGPETKGKVLMPDLVVA